MKSVRVPGSAQGEIVNEGFDHVPAGLADRGSSAVICGVGFDEFRVELVLSDEQAKAIAEARLAVLVAVISSRSWPELLGRT